MPELYEPPSEQEVKDLADSRNRSRGEKARCKRLKRQRKLLSTEIGKQPVYEPTPGAPRPQAVHRCVHSHSM